AEREGVRGDQFAALRHVPGEHTRVDVHPVVDDATESLCGYSPADQVAREVRCGDDHGVNALLGELVRGEVRVIHRVSHPPSTGSWMPSMYFASSESSHDTAEATSSGVPTRGTSSRCFMNSSASSLVTDS